ncbi:MAG: acyl-CoA dehydrogenase family protein [Planctomycetota bacterium]
MTGRAKPWYETAFEADYMQLYAHRDLESARREVRWLLESGVGGRTLDLCCGFGRHSLAMLERGLEVWGMDLSMDLLASHGTLDGGDALAGRLVRADMRHLPYGTGAFESVVNLFSSYGYLRGRRPRCARGNGPRPGTRWVVGARPDEPPNASAASWCLSPTRSATVSSCTRSAPWKMGGGGCANRCGWWTRPGASVSGAKTCACTDRRRCGPCWRPWDCASKRPTGISTAARGRKRSAPAPIRPFPVALPGPSYSGVYNRFPLSPAACMATWGPLAILAALYGLLAPSQPQDPDSAMQQNIVFSEKARELQAIAKEIAEKYVRPNAAKYDKAQEYNREAANAVAKAGLFRTFIPTEYGGHGAGVLALALVAEELAKADSGFGVAFAVNALGSFTIILGGNEEQKKK